MCISQAVHRSADLSLSLVESFLNPKNVFSIYDYAWAHWRSAVALDCKNAAGTGMAHTFSLCGATICHRFFVLMRAAFTGRTFSASLACAPLRA